MWCDLKRGKKINVYAAEEIIKKGMTYDYELRFVVKGVNKIYK